MSLLPLRDDDPFDFAGSVGHNGDNDRADVIKAQLLLANAGELDLPLPGVPTGWAGDGLTQAIQKVQKANGLPADGLLLPLRDGAVGENGEGETLYALKGLVGDKVSGAPIPTPQQVDRFFDDYARDPETTPPFQRPEKRDFGRDSEKGSQEAALPLALPLLLMGAPLAMGAGQYLKQQYEKNRSENFTRPLEAPVTPPLQPVGDAEQAGATLPPLQPPEGGEPLRGRPAADKTPDGERLIPPDMKEWISGLPPAQQPLAEGLAGIIVEANPYGSRGKPETEKANRIMVRTCLEELQAYPELAGQIRHVAGATQNGREGGDYMTEEVIRAREGKTFSRPDGTFGRLDAEEEKVDQTSPYTARMNTVDVKKTGGEHDRSNLTANEGRRFDKLENNIRVGVAGWARKMKPGESEVEYARYVASRCRAMWDDLDGKLRQDGVLPAR